VEAQYLPKSLRGTSNNPYSIMNAMTEKVMNDPTPEANISTNELETTIVAAASPVITSVISEYNSVQKEATIPSEPI
jgi:hypothetical protein